MVATRPASLNRKLLGGFLKNPETIKAFENLSLNSDDLAEVISGIQSAAVLVLGLSDLFENERVVATDGEVQLTDGGPGSNLTFGLSDTGVVDGVYGDASHTVQIAISPKGRITLAQAHPLNSDNVAEGTTNLYFTVERARASVSGGTGISYDAPSGVIAVNSTLAAYAGGSVPSAFTLSIVNSADAAAWRTAISAVPTSRSISTGTGLVGGGNLTADRTLSLATSGVTAASYGSATKVPTLTVDAYGRVTIASENTIPALASGTYTPTLTPISNLDAVTPYACQYQRVGDTVTVSGRIDVDPTAISASTVVDISLPIAGTDFTADSQAGGSGAVGGVQQSARIAALVGGAVARLSFLSTDTDNRPMNFCFMYRIMP